MHPRGWHYKKQKKDAIRDIPNKETDIYKVKKYSENINPIIEFINKFQKQNKEMENRILTKENFEIEDNWTYFIVKYNEKINYALTNWKLISKSWFIRWTHFINQIAVVQSIEGKWNYLTIEGNFLSEKWLDKIYKANDWASECILNNQKFRIDKKWNMQPAE